MVDKDNTFDDLLDAPISEDEKQAVSELQDGGVAQPSATDARIAELERQLAAAESRVEAAVKPEAQKDTEHSATVRSTAAFDRGAEKLEAVSADDDSFTIHFLDDGFTFADRVWYAGQTVTFKRNGRAYLDTVDRNGDSWLNDLSINAQRARFGKILIGEGPYTGPEFTDEIAVQDAKRGSAAPIISI